MKSVTLKASQKRLFVISLGFAAVLFACGDDGDRPAPGQVEKVTKALTADGGRWTPPATGGVTVDGVDVTADLFPGFSITFLKGTLTTTGTTPVWLREDTWRFKDETATVIIRGQDDKEITIESISDTQLKLTLEWTTTTTAPGRQRSIKGKYQFVLNK